MSALMMRQFIKNIARKLLLPIAGFFKSMVIVKGYVRLDAILEEQKGLKKIVHLSENFLMTKPHAIDKKENRKFLPQASGLLDTTEQTYVASLKQVSIISSNPAVVTKDGFLIYDLISPYMPVDPPEHYLCSSVYVRKPGLLMNKSFSLAAPDSATNYFHWMVDALPRIEIARRAGVKFEEIDTFIVSGKSQPMQIDSLKLLGIPKEKIVSLSDQQHLFCKEVVVTSPCLYAGNVPAWIVKFLQDTFEKYRQYSDTLPKAIYLSRRKNNKRKLLNEQRLVERLQANGFTEIFLEELSLEEQVAHFYNADFIVGLHGAAFTNAVFCRPQTSLLEIFSPNYINQSYYTISNAASLSYHYLVADGNDNTTVANHLIEENFSLSEANFLSIDQFLRQLFQERTLQ